MIANQPQTITVNGHTVRVATNVEFRSSANLGTKTITSNNTYKASDDNLDGYSQVTVNVEGGGSATLGTKTVQANGTYKASDDSLDGYSKVTVSVPASAVDSGTKSITANGNNQDVVGYAAVNVAVPNSYSAGDEGKVVDDGALVSQTAHADVTPTTSDQTIDTTTNNSIKVKGDADLVATNIKKDVQIFGVTGSYEGSSGITPDEIATGNVPSTLSLATTTLSLPYAFAYWPMTNISAPNLQTISGTYALAYCRNLGTVKFPELTTISDSKVFANSGGTDLNNTNCILVFPKLALGNVRATFDRGYFDTIDIGPNTTNFYGDTFYHNTGDQTVKKLIIRKADAVVSASTTGAINGLRDVYIPKTMYDHLGDGTALDYQAATNWITQYNAGKVTFHSIEGTAYDGYWADGTPIT